MKFSENKIFLQILKNRKIIAQNSTTPFRTLSTLLVQNGTLESKQLKFISQKNNKNHFKILSWNIDGLHESNLEYRTLGVVKTIQNQKPDIILLQEVIEDSEIIIRDALQTSYNFKSGSSLLDVTHKLRKDYYTLILAKKTTCKIQSSQIIDFNNSSMRRNLLKLNLSYQDKVKICAMTSHLESLVPFAQIRIEQLKFCFDEMKRQDDDCFVFFGGDLNIRQKEFKSIKDKPENIFDLWELTGSRKECSYTWDCALNTNLGMTGQFKPRARFDRLYFRPASNPVKLKPKMNKFYTLRPVYFDLQGLEKLEKCNLFCSDHWAIQGHCELIELIHSNKINS